MGKFSRDKGARGEREIVGRHLALGIRAERVPLSGAGGGSFRGDVDIENVGRCEVKNPGWRRWVSDYREMAGRQRGAVPAKGQAKPVGGPSLGNMGEVLTP